MVSPRILLASALALGAASCGSSESGTVETEDGEVAYEVDRGDGETTATFTGENGEEMTFRTGADDDVELPSGFTLYPGATVLSSTRVDSGEGGGTMVSMQVDAAPDEVVAFYREQAESAGVEIRMEMNAGDTRIVGGEGEGGLVFSINASPVDGGGTTAQLTVGSKS